MQALTLTLPTRKHSAVLLLLLLVKKQLFYEGFLQVANMSATLLHSYNIRDIVHIQVFN